MLLYIALAVALAIGTVAGIDCSRDCKKDKWDNTPTVLPSQKCKAGKAWRACLDELLMARCPNVVYPQKLNEAGPECDKADPAPANVPAPAPGDDALDCNEMYTCSKVAEIRVARGLSSKCRLAREWRSCLDNYLVAGCQVDYPFKLNKEEARSCYAKVPKVKDDDDDAVIVDTSDDDDDNTPPADVDDDDDNTTPPPDTVDDNTTPPPADAAPADDDGNDDDDSDSTGGDSTPAPSNSTADGDDDSDAGDDTGDGGAEACDKGFTVCDKQYGPGMSSKTGIDKCIDTLGWIGCNKNVIAKGCKDISAELSTRETEACGEGL